MLCAIWYHLYHLKNVKNTLGGVLLLVQLQATESNTPLWVFFTFFKLYKWYQIAQCITYECLSATVYPRSLYHLFSKDSASLVFAQFSISSIVRWPYSGQQVENLWFLGLQIAENVFPALFPTVKALYTNTHYILFLSHICPSFEMLSMIEFLLSILRGRKCSDERLSYNSIFYCTNVIRKLLK